MTRNSIWVVSSHNSPDVRGGGWHAVDITKFREHLDGFLVEIRSVLDGIDATTENYALTEVQLALEISASGSIGLLGSGSKVGGKAGLELKFSRKLPVSD